MTDRLEHGREYPSWGWLTDRPPLYTLTLRFDVPAAPDDAGPAPSDAGAPAGDAGSVDAGAGPRDAGGGPEDDAGSTVRDAGTEEDRSLYEPYPGW